MGTRGLILAACAAIVLGGGAVLADGTETLGPFPAASGTGIVAKGVGMVTQPATLTIEVPDGAAVQQVLLYWEGFMATNVPGDDTILVDGAEVTGDLIGGPSYFFDGAYPSTFRADITDRGLIGAGINSIELDGLEFTNVNNGAGLLVIFDDGSSDAMIDVRDGSDTAFIGFPDPRFTTVPQSFTFPAAAADRTAVLNLFFSSVSGTMSGFGLRPSSIEITVQGPGGPFVSIFSDLLDSVDGEEWDTFTISVDIPAGATMLTVQAFSRDDTGIGGLPASFVWNAAGFAIEPETPPGVPGRMTGGGSVFRIDDVRVTRGFQIHCDLREPNNIEVNWPGGNRFHLTELTGAVCTDSPAIDQTPPGAPFDTFEGQGVGKYNNVPGATIEFVFVDAGEPGTSDTATIKVWDKDGNLVLDVPGDPSVPGYLDHGNVQAHKDNQSTL